MGRKRKHPKHKPKKKWFQKENDWGDYVFDWGLGLKGETWREIFALLILIFSVIVFLGLFNAAGGLGTKLATMMRFFFGGLGTYILPFVLFWFGILLLFPHLKGQRLSRIIGLVLFVSFLSAFRHLYIPAIDAKDKSALLSGGGVVGYMISQPMRQSFGLFVAFLLVIVVLIISLMMIFDLSLKRIFGFETKEEEEDEQKHDKHRAGQAEGEKRSFWRGLGNIFRRRHDRAARAPVIEVDPRPVNRDSTWNYPPIEILKDSDDVANPGNIQKNFDIIQKTLATFGIEIAVGEANIGPTVTQYTLKPKEGVKLNQITARANDLALALASKSLRIEAPIPGTNYVGIEQPNVIPAKVTLKEVVISKEFRAVKSKLAIALGRDVSGTAMAIDLETMPHLLIAGATGSGKSVCINSIITTFLFNNSPADLRLILVDPKRVELTNLNGIPHLLTPVITEVPQIISALKWAIWEMEQRYKLFAEFGKRNIGVYNQSPGPEGKLPYIIIIIDELADLMSQAAADVEGSIVRLAQMARATGIHLIIATQRPSVDVLTGLIKANIPSRIAFATASQVDSRTILDMSGAEKLLGNGDMLFIGNGLTKPKRVQGCYVSDGEIEDLVRFLRAEREADYDEAVLQFRATKSAGGVFAEGGADDEMYEDAVRVITEAGKASASLLQRRLRVGYARAARLLDLLEENGAIGPADGARPREVLISNSGSEAYQARGENDSYEDYHR